VGQVNGLTQVDLGDWRFGLPVRVSARTHAGQDGVVAIEREVAMSGPIHDKGVLILQGCWARCFAHVAPLALNASIVFEQEYQGIEGDSASCAELLALLSSLAGDAPAAGHCRHRRAQPARRDHAGGWHQREDRRLVRGLRGRGSRRYQHGVLIPARNLRHLMLDRRVVDAVGQGLFRVYVAHELGEALTLLSSQPAGWSAQQSRGGPFEADTVLGRVQQNLRGFRRACRRATRR
jgi:predicted ATP-dependent protease